MTRINTNVSSLVAQKNLGRSNADLNTTLTRLSTGLRINSGKDDPAGLIASEALRSDITSVEKAITNSERANQLIATADSALGQVSSLLNDIRGLISEAANTGALSDEQIAANQLQIDSSLEAIDRIAQVTSFQGKRLLDGNLDFITQNVNSSAIEGLRIDQANFGTQSSIGVKVNVVQQATRGTLNYGFGAVADDLVLEIGGANGTEAFNFAKGSTIEEIASAVNLVSDATGVEALLETAATKGELTVSSFGTDNDILLTANEAGFDPGDVRIKYSKGTSSTTTASYTAPVGADPGKLEVTLGVSDYEAASLVVDTVGDNNAFTLTANEAGADYNGTQVVFADGAELGDESASYDASTKTLTITKNAASNADAIVAAINNATERTAASFTTSGAANASLTVTSKILGDETNSVGIEYVDNASLTGGALVSFDEANNKLVVQIDTGVSTGTEVRDAINAQVGDLFSAAYATGNDGSGAVATGDIAGSSTFAGGTTTARSQASVLVEAGNADASIHVRALTGGTEIDGVQLIYSTSGAVAKGAETAAYDADANTLTVQINVASTGAEVVTAIDSLTGLFDARNALGSDGSGVVQVGDTTGTTLFIGGDRQKTTDLFTAAVVETTGYGAGAGIVATTGAYGSTASGGITGGDIVATANDVIEAINAATGNNKVTASLAAGNDGHDTVTEFTNYAYSGVAEQNTSLQFLSPEDSPNVRFVSNADTSLSIDTTTDPRVEGLSQAIIQNADANGTFSITAKLKGTDYDGYTISFVDNNDLAGGGDEYAVLDKEAKTLVLNIQDGVSTAEDAINAINNDAYVSQFFEAENFGSSDGTDALDINELTIPAGTDGGLVSEGTLIVNLETDADGNVKTTADDLIAFFDDPSAFISDPTEAANTLAYLQDRGISVTNVSGSDGSGILSATTEDITFATSGTELEDAQASGTTYSVNGVNAQLSFTAINSGADYDNVKVQFVNDATVTAGVDERGEYDAANKTLTFYIEEGLTTAADIADIFDSADGNYDESLSLLFSATASGGATVTTDDTATLTGGVIDTGSTDGAALLGNSDLENTGLSFQATNFGADSFVSVKALTGTFNLTDQSGNTNVDRSSGTDVDVRINGIQAIGDGLKASINTSSLDLSFSLGENVEDDSSFEFEIVGGGALFQLGPDVVSNQQARLGIQSVSTATLGGVSGRLFELRSGGSKSLSEDVGGAAKVVDEVISVVTSLRGRLGAFQKTTLDSNIYSLNDTLANLTEAESSIRDADFAAESAKLTRAQILVQAGTNTLGIANQNPQNVLSLLR
ncbi:flagellin [Blastopirellula sp. J2-11]|uniref:flagellin N-terminal helical domain-containing protein n=1 Tax=Blastopirellula sp. J2-11 TaxID=2943192 RepID=UPI0021CABEFF|nr:flagellin [Blastopirellula sp. J2-11]UUO05836.1 flagellin [Blastopirellula sp. J2-11]